MDPAATAAIDVAEAAYDLRLGAEDWLPNLLDKGAPLFDHGFGCAAAIWAGRSPDRQPLLAQVSVGSGPPELASSLTRAIRDAGPQLRQSWTAQADGVRVASESELERPNILLALEEQIGCPDVLGVWATDSELHGVAFSMPSPALISLTQRARARWQRIAIHVEAGHRLRRRLGCALELGTTPTSELPLDADAVIDPKRFALTHASGPARDKDTKEVLREAAIRVDKARSRLRKEDAEQALEVWQGLVRGRWSLVDWFDGEGRRFIVAIANAPGCGDPRGLSEREHQVATYAARGETGKLISYRFGISRQRVSFLLKSGMRKLGAKTQAQLVMRMRGFERFDDAA